MGSYPESSQAPTHVEVELGCDNTNLSASAGSVANKTGKRTASSSKKSSPKGKKLTDQTQIGKKSPNLSRAASPSHKSGKGRETVDSNHSRSAKASKSGKTNPNDKPIKTKQPKKTKPLIKVKN